MTIKEQDNAGLRIELPDAAATEELGACLGRGLEPGHVLALIGELGAGKTTLVRGLARGAGADPEQVHSPTFTMIQIYPGRLIHSTAPSPAFQGGVESAAQDQPEQTPALRPGSRRLTLHHVDLYRLERYEELEAIGLDEALEGLDSACALEWADKFPRALPPGRLELRLSYAAAGRRAELRATDPQHARLMQCVKDCATLPGRSARGE